MLHRHCLAIVSYSCNDLVFCFMFFFMELFMSAIVLQGINKLKEAADDGKV